MKGGGGIETKIKRAIINNDVVLEMNGSFSFIPVD